MSFIKSKKLLVGLLLAPLCAPLAEAQTVGTTDTVVGVLVCVPDATGTLSVSQAPCPASPVASLQVVSGVVLSQTDYSNLLTYDGPVDQTEGVNLALTCAGWVVALYLLSLGIGTVIRLIKRV
jgi:hypothetical protein